MIYIRLTEAPSGLELWMPLSGISTVTAHTLGSMVTSVGGNTGIAVSQTPSEVHALIVASRASFAVDMATAMSNALHLDASLATFASDLHNEPWGGLR